MPNLWSSGGRAQAGESLPRTVLPMVLVGVMVDSADPARSACLIRCADPDKRRSASYLDVGTTACELAEVKEIRTDAVILRNLLTNRLELLPLLPSASSAGMPEQTATPPPDPAIVQASPDLVSVEVPQASVNHYLVNLSELLNSARATPRFRDAANGQRAMEGFEVGQIKEGSVVEKLGLKNGDVIVEVNGEALDSLATVVRLFSEAQSLSQATLTVLRDGRRMSFVFSAR